MMQQSYLINRRQVLRGSGAALALPLLDIMSPAIQASPQTKPPIRLGVLYKGNGVHPPSWDISGTGETDFEFSPLVKPLEEIRDDVLFLSNLDHIDVPSLSLERQGPMAETSIGNNQKPLTSL